MQNQQGPVPRKRARAIAQHDRQAAGLSDDVFKGGTSGTAASWTPVLRNPWKPVGRLFDQHKRPRN